MSQSKINIRILGCLVVATQFMGEHDAKAGFFGRLFSRKCGDAIVEMGGNKSAKVEVAALSFEQIHYQIWGEKNPDTLVLIHGLDSAIPTFLNVVEALGEKYRVVAVDQRGHGQTPDIGDNYTSDVMAADLKALFDGLKIEKAIVLGHSMGARTAVRFASKNPERVQAIVIEDMELQGRVASTPQKDAQALQFANSIRQNLPKTFPNRQALIDALTPFYGEEAPSLSQRRAVQNPDGTMTLLFNVAVSRLYGYQGNAENLLPDLRDLQGMPVLVMQANPRLGTAIDADGLAQMQAARPDLQLAYFDDSGHVIHRAQPDKFLRTLTQFADGVLKSDTSLNKLTGNQTGATDMVDAKISMMGVEKDAQVIQQTMLPRGSALATSSGALAKQGITQIIHAASGAMTKSGGVYEPTLQSVALSVQNSTALAKQFGHKSVAVPFIGGGIFVQRIGVTREALAKTIIEAGLSVANDIDVKFVVMGESDFSLFRDSKAALEKEIKDPLLLAALQKVQVLEGSITDFKVHGASAIVNAANMEVQFGGGLSGAIGRATEAAQKIDREARELIESLRGLIK